MDYELQANRMETAANNMHQNKKKQSMISSVFDKGNKSNAETRAFTSQSFFTNNVKTRVARPMSQLCAKKP